MNPITANPPDPLVAPPFPWPDPAFARNRALVPPDELGKWTGKHVAWSWDGIRILAGADTLAGLMDELRRTGVDHRRVVFDYVDPPDA